MGKALIAGALKGRFIVKVIGISVGYVVMKDRLSRAWKLEGQFNLLYVGFGYFLVKFELVPYRDNVLTNGPWFVFDHCLGVLRWS